MASNSHSKTTPDHKTTCEGNSNLYDAQFSVGITTTAEINQLRSTVPETNRNRRETKIGTANASKRIPVDMYLLINVSLRKKLTDLGANSTRNHLVESEIEDEKVRLVDSDSTIFKNA
jgi:hypothetical protein